MSYTASDRYMDGGIKGIKVSKNCECDCHCSPYGSICEKEAKDQSEQVPRCCRDYEREAPVR